MSFCTGLTLVVIFLILLHNLYCLLDFSFKSFTILLPIALHYCYLLCLPIGCYGTLVTNFILLSCQTGMTTKKRMQNICAAVIVHYFSLSFCSSFLMSASSNSESLSLLM